MQFRTCLVGAGSIAEIHVEVLKSLKKVDVVALVDPSASRRAAFARRWGIAQTYATLADAVAKGGFDCVHILTPPNTHAQLTKDVIAAGLNVLVEKPVAESQSEADELLEKASANNVTAAVNQNFVHHPAFAKLKTSVESGAIGPLRHIAVAYNAPLRQLAARQFGHWMFRQPKNILLEQAVHPLSQLVALIGPIDHIDASAPGGLEISPGVHLHSVANAELRAGGVTANLQFAVGRPFPFWQIVAIGDDGVMTADILANRFFAWRRTRWMDMIDGLLSGWRSAIQIVVSATCNAADYVLALIKVKGRSDPFYLSMAGSIAAFYDRLNGRSNSGMTDLAFGRELVRICESIADQCFPGQSTPATLQTPSEKCDVAVLGGTGFIGASTVEALLAAGKSVRVMARNTTNLAPVFYREGVSVVQGDVTNPENVAAAVGGATDVVNLAHGGGSGSWSEIEKALVGSARIVAEACKAASVHRLIHIGSVAALYAGDAGTTITGATPPDPCADERADYSRAKAMADQMLLNMHRDSGLPVVILRPGVVVGAGTSPFHSGLGVFNNDQHCIGWNAGQNPLPFILVEDVAAAIVQALAAPGIDGKAYNLVGHIQPTAREFISELASVTKRPLAFHGSSVHMLYAEELLKWVIKRVVGRTPAMPSMRDLRSRGLVAAFDCSDAEKDLGWTPVSDRSVFFKRAFAGLIDP